MDDDDWMGGGNEGGLDRDQYSYEDSEQFEDDSICSVGTDEGGSKRADWGGWEGGEENGEGGGITIGDAPGDLPSTSGIGSAAAAPSLSVQQLLQNADSSPRGGSSSRLSSARGEGRAASAASTLTVIPSTGRMNAATAAGTAENSNIPSLFNTAARACARSLPFCALEDCYNRAMLYRYTFPHGEVGDRLRAMKIEGNHAIPDKIFLAITWWCFPESEDDIRLYSCLPNGGMDEFNRGESIYTSGGVENVMQIGYHLSAKVSQSSNLSTLSPSLCDFSDDVNRRRGERKEGTKNTMRRDSHSNTYEVSVGIDRCRIVSCECSCSSRSWCQHVVALCLFRLHQKHKVEFRVTIWDSINELKMSDLKKFAQYFVNELPRQYLPMAQKLIDGLTNPKSDIFRSHGAPDPTDGGHDIVALWSIDQQLLHERVARTLYRFCQPSPTVHCDVQFLSSTPPPIASEWQLLLQPLKTKKPEGIWNLLSIVSAMFKRKDENGTALLHVITDEVLASTHMLIWWLVASLQQSGRWAHSSDRKSNPLMSNYEVPQLCAAALCDEMVSLWRVAALNPALTQEERRQLAAILQLYHKTAVERMWLLIDSMGFKGGKSMESHSNIISLLIATTVNEDRATLSTATARFSLESFPGFYPALQACHLYWNPSDVSVVPRSMTSLIDTSLSPHLPQITGGLRRPYTVSSTCPQNSSMFYSGFVDSSSSKKRKSKKKKSSKSGSSKKSSRHELLDAFERFELDELESAESGQESDMPGPSSRSTVRRRNRRSGSNYPIEDVDMLFAAAHQPLDGMELKLARCEALFAHGYTAAAAARAAELVVSMRGALPRLVWNYDRHVEGMADPSPSASSVSIPIPPPKHHKQFIQRAPPHGGIHPSQYYNTTPHHLAYPQKKRYGKVVAVSDAAAAAAIVNQPTPVQLPDLGVHAISQLTCIVVQRALLLAKQLLPYPIHRHSIFRLLVDVLEAPKGAMSTNSLQVKLFHLESEVKSILNSMPLDSEELKIIRERAISLARWDLSPCGKGWMVERGVPPLPLASFIFNSLVTRDNILLHEEDEHLGVAACLAVLGARHPYPETTFPMLGECIRRQKGEITVLLLRRYKDDSQKLGLVLDRLLDSTQHRLYSYHKSNGAYFLVRDPLYGQVLAKGEKPTMNAFIGHLLTRKMGGEKEEEERIEEEEKNGISSRRPSIQHSIGSWESGGQGGEERSGMEDSEESGGNNEDRSSISTRRSSDEGNESSSNSLSQSGSSFPPLGVSRGRGGVLYSRGGNGSPSVGDGQRFNNKKTRPSPPFEAHAHYLFELAKRILAEAGGDQSSSVFRHAPNQHGPHRKLLMASFLTGLYALGLSNKASSSWASRTYSNHVSWTTAQALDIGAPAIDVIRDTWFDHLTPPEAATLADKAGQSRDQSSQDSGAHLALSVLHHCHALSSVEGQRALEQCRLQGPVFLERAVKAVDDVSKKEGVFPEIMFSAARLWASIQLDTDPSHPIFSQGQPFNGPPVMTHNPYYYAAIGFMQQQQAAAAASAAYAAGSSAPPPLVPFYPPPPLLRQQSRGDDDGASQSSTSSGASGGVIPSLRPSPMHTSHSAPNLGPGLGPGQSGAPMVPPPALPIAHDPRVERLTKAQHLGLRAMEAVSNRLEDRNYSKYSARPPFYEYAEWLFELSCEMGPMAIQYFCDYSTKFIYSPHLLAKFVIRLLHIFPNVQHGNLMLAATSNRQPNGFGQGKFRSSAINAGWQRPTADVFDRTMEMAYSAITQKFGSAGSRVMSIVDIDEVMDVLQCIHKLLVATPILPTGCHLFNELLTFTTKQKCASETHKILASKISGERFWQTYTAH